jgi:hypothetical protein
MNDRTPAGPKLIMGLHTGAGTVGGNVGGGSPITIQPNQFGLSNDLVWKLVRPVLNLENDTMCHLVVEKVANYATKLVQLMNAETQIESAVKVVLEQFNGKLRVISFSTNSENVRFEEIRVQVEINGKPLYPNEPRPEGLCVAVGKTIIGVLQPLRIAVSTITIPSDYSESHTPQEIQKDGPTRFPSPTRPMANEVGDPYSIYTL